MVDDRWRCCLSYGVAHVLAEVVEQLPAPRVGVVVDGAQRVGDLGANWNARVSGELLG
jgi:hypothetical protein